MIAKEEIIVRTEDPAAVSPRERTGVRVGGAPNGHSPTIEADSWPLRADAVTRGASNALHKRNAKWKVAPPRRK